MVDVNEAIMNQIDRPARPYPTMNICISYSTSARVFDTFPYSTSAPGFHFYPAGVPDSELRLARPRIIYMNINEL